MVVQIEAHGGGTRMALMQYCKAQAVYIDTYRLGAIYARKARKRPAWGRTELQDGRRRVGGFYPHARSPSFRSLGPSEWSSECVHAALLAASYVDVM